MEQSPSWEAIHLYSTNRLLQSTVVTQNSGLIVKRHDQIL
jgi:hypothetical protein